MSNNKVSGNIFELQFSRQLSNYGFWVHRIVANAAGQPFDIIAARNGKTFAIDCKVCDTDRFALSRVEDNQRYAMELWAKTGNGVGWFAIKLKSGEIRMLPATAINEWEGKRKQVSLSAAQIKENSIPLESWVALCE